MAEDNSTRERHPPKKLGDYVINFSPNPSDSSSNMSDTEEHSQREQALLDRTTAWEMVLSKMTNEDGTFVSDWTNPDNDAVIKKYFKIRRKLLSPDELACQYFWFGTEDRDVFYDIWKGKSDVQNLLSFLRQTTSVIDTKETDLFFRHDGRADNIFRQFDLSDTIQTAVKDSAKFKDTRTLLDRVEGPSFRAIADKMWPGVRDWLSYLGHIIKKDPASTLEYAFEELARNFITTCGLVCANGNSEQLSLPGIDRKCEPDLIFAAQHSTSPYWGAVEAKRMSRDPTFKHFFKDPTKGIMKSGVEDATESKADSPSVAEDECIPSKRRCVTYSEEDKEDDDTDPGGSTLPACVRDTVDVFFSQLFGQIISLDCHQPSRRNRRMGIGVVGFRIFFIAFYAKPSVPFAKIPETKGAKTEVHIAGPLCILDAEDRENIARILLLLASEARSW